MKFKIEKSAYLTVNVINVETILNQAHYIRENSNNQLNTSFCPELASGLFQNCFHAKHNLPFTQNPLEVRKRRC